MKRGGTAAVVLGAIGVVFGDIGTSPLYTLRTVFAPEHGLEPGNEQVFGVVSLIFWAITLIVSVKYVTFIMRADNDGEGGIMALIALIQRANLRSPRRADRPGPARRLRRVAVLRRRDDHARDLGAVRGRGPRGGRRQDLKEFVIPITLVVLTVLFAVAALRDRPRGPVLRADHDRRGSRCWRSPASAGCCSTRRSSARCRPHHGAEFLFNHGHEAFVALGGVVLAVTGAEALYADMGHFGAGAIRRGWFFLVFPALVLQYLGQGALILEDPQATASPFFLMFPEWARIPMVILSTVAAIIASQAVISGAFSVTRQAIRLGFLPRLQVRHTSREEVGQVYVPAANWIIFAAVVAPGGRLRLLREAGERLRHRGHRHAGDRHAAVLLRRPLPVAELARGW